MGEILEFRNLESSTQVALAHGCHGMMSLWHLLARRTNGKEPLMDYFQSHVVTLEKYFRIMWQKEMEYREVVEQLKESRRKER
jgi:hypothetical protein